MAESTITKILLRRGPSKDLNLSGNSTDKGVILDTGETGFTTDTQRLYVGGNNENIPIPRIDEDTLIYKEDSTTKVNTIALNVDSMTAQLKTSNTGPTGNDDPCSDKAAICASAGGIYSYKSIYTKGDVISFCSSDEQLKDNIKIIDDPLERLNSIKGVTFEWNCLQNTYNGPDTGILAQDVEKTELPGLVQTRDDGYKAVKYERLIPLLVESVKQLNQKVEDLSNLINDDR